MKKFIYTFIIGLVLFFILGGIFGTLIFLPEMASWHEAFPDAVRETPDFLSGFIVGLIQLIALIILLDKLNINNLKDGAVFGLIYSVALWLIIDLQMLSVTNIISYDYIRLDAVLSAVMGAAMGGVMAWSLKKYA
ncbi:MAG: hypothetical protein P8I43_08510 [Bacteroidia bacterium]|nr:hypothetical protein [Bacteroidia bacterium]|tara:strand:- start:4909 stop:5313 length:405 start_codon:yes stop_codon:yes gene_type:complete